MATAKDKSLGPYGQARNYIKTGQIPHPSCVTWNSLKVAIAKNLMGLAHFYEWTLLQQLTITNYKDYLRRALLICVSWEMRLTLIMYYHNNAAQINKTEDICVVIYRLNGLLELFEAHSRERHEFLCYTEPLRFLKNPKRNQNGGLSQQTQPAGGKKLGGRKRERIPSSSSSTC